MLSDRDMKDKLMAILRNKSEHVNLGGGEVEPIAVDEIEPIEVDDVKMLKVDKTELMEVD